MKGTLAIKANGRRSWLSRFWGPGTDINEKTQQNLTLGKRYINKTICHSSEGFYMGSPMNKEKSNAIRIILKIRKVNPERPGSLLEVTQLISVRAGI